MPCSGQSWTRPVGSFSLECCQRNLPSLIVEGQQAAQVDVRRIALQPAAAVVGADVHLAVGDDRVAVGLRAELGDPLDVLGRCPASTRRSSRRTRRSPTRWECSCRRACCCGPASRPTGSMSCGPTPRLVACSQRAHWRRCAAALAGRASWPAAGPGRPPRRCTSSEACGSQRVGANAFHRIMVSDGG